MSHQDKDDLRTPVAELKELLAPIRQVSLDGISRHGNAWLDLTGVMSTAILTFGWNQQQTLSDRFDDAQVAANRALGNVLLAGSFEALMVVLRACGDSLGRVLSHHLVFVLSQSKDWLLYGRPTFAVDGSQFAVPRTTKNLAAFAAASRKAKSSYKNASDYSKAKTTQIAVSLCLHLGTGFPAFWNFGGSADSERGLLLGMLERLPSNARLVMDAYYFGFDFWNHLIDSGVTFVVRAGKNIDLLGQLSIKGKVKCRGSLVLYWPQNAIDAGHAPIVLSLVTVMVGRKKMCLLTNELTLSEEQMADLYARRWGDRSLFPNRQAKLRAFQITIADSRECQTRDSVDPLWCLDRFDRSHSIDPRWPSPESGACPKCFCQARCGSLRVQCEEIKSSKPPIAMCSGERIVTQEREKQQVLPTQETKATDGRTEHRVDQR